MNTVKILVSILFASIIGSLAWAFFLPSSILISEKVNIYGPVEQVFVQVNNFHNWKNWSPYNDSILLTQFAGPQKGAGSQMLWNDKKEGRSVQTILESVENQKVVTELVFNDQQNAAKSYFYFQQLGDSTEVKWEMKVEDLSYPFGRFVGYMIKKGATHNFKKGLEKLKTFLQLNPGLMDYSGYEIMKENTELTHYLSYTDSALMSDLSQNTKLAFQSIYSIAAKNKLTPMGHPKTEWMSYNPQAYSKFRCLVQIGKEVKIKEQKVEYYAANAINVIWLKYVGSYENSAIGWETLDKYLANNKLQMAGFPYEEYVSGPENEADTLKWVTNIYFPVK